MGDASPSLHAEILKFFTECFAELHQRIDVALVAEDRIELRDAAHAAKGAAQNAAAVALAETLVTLEHRAMDADLPELQDLSKDVGTHFGAVQKFVETLTSIATH